MNQSKVTDFFNVSRKNVQRNIKKRCAVHLQVKGPSGVEDSDIKRTIKREEGNSQSDTSKDEALESPAFKRYRLLIPEVDEKVCSTTASSHLSVDHHNSKTSAVEKCKSEAQGEQCMLSTSHHSRMQNLLRNSECISSATPRSGSRMATEEFPMGAFRLPAYQKYAHLIPSPSKTVESSSEIGLSVLPLPFKYKILVGVFRAMDNVVNIMHNRKELLSFSALQESVQKVLRRDFKEQTFGQIRSFYSNSFSARYEMNVPKFGRKISGKYELIISANLAEDGTSMSSMDETKFVYNATRLIQRREQFLSKVMTFLLTKHREFLCTTLNLKSSEIPPNSEIKRWHPSFPLEEIDIPEAEPLPPRPDAEDKKILSAKDAVNMFREKGLLKEAVLCDRVSTKFRGDREPDSNEGTMKVTNLSDKKRATKLKGISSSLLEKIRVKEAAKTAQSLNRGGPDWEKKQAMLSRLPDLAIHTWNLFATSRKSVLTMNYLCEKIADSHPSGLSESCVYDHLRLLAESVPGWLELLAWKPPHARIIDMKRNLADVRGDLIKLYNTCLS